MAIIVDKVQKREDIALSCRELVLEKGIKNLTISEIAKTARVGKGTIYDYFKNKEDLVFEIINYLLAQYNEEIEQKIAKSTTTKEKIKAFMYFFYDEDKAELRGFYKEFRSIGLTSANEEMIEFNKGCDIRYDNWFNEIFEEGINKGEIIPESLQLVRGLFASAEGMFINACSIDSLDTLENDINTYIDSFFNLIEVKK